MELAETLPANEKHTNFTDQATISLMEWIPLRMKIVSARLTNCIEGRQIGLHEILEQAFSDHLPH